MMTRTDAQAARFFYTALAAAVFAYAIVMVNAYTRVSGAGCAAGSDCYERQLMVASPDEDLLPALGYGERSWETKVHPYLAAALAVLVVRLAYLGWQVDREVGNRRLVIPAIVFVLLFALVLPDLPAAGLKLRPSAAFMRLLAASTMLALLWWLVLREQRFWKSVDDTPFTRALRPRTIAALVIVAVAIAIGGWSNISRTGLPCADFPTCHGAWWPSMDLAGAFATLRYADVEHARQPPGLGAATAIHMLHRAAALIVLLYVGWLAGRVFWTGIQENLCRYGLVILIALLGQVSLGVMAVVMGMPMPVALAHSAVTTLLLLSMMRLYHAIRPPGVSIRRALKSL
ncbi:MAG: COX15/CtaA family protein [Acidiferrobacterales bacterium]|jgi:cytochrome c oxidase assembly protein subunit 15